MPVSRESLEQRLEMQPVPGQSSAMQIPEIPKRGLRGQGALAGAVGCRPSLSPWNSLVSFWERAGRVLGMLPLTCAELLQIGEALHRST